MKLSFIAFLVGAVAVPVSVISLHLRLTMHSKIAEYLEQCEWEDKAVRCNQTYLFCLRTSSTYGQCLKTNPGIGDRCCGVKHRGATWSRSCIGENVECKVDAKGEEEGKSEGVKNVRPPQGERSRRAVGELRPLRFTTPMLCLEQRSHWWKCCAAQGMMLKIASVEEPFGLLDGKRKT
ncbi:hypothetical protein CCR75_005301 [Bremia lactucae]|uniref:Uncharacterized protein n=1 Tax=Bremia lactucae TaxID=4779 RepID=A0A976FQP5_BRELC|nr:hypothetical protein CCR75_005301 [Bremia lactucae]